MPHPRELSIVVCSCGWRTGNTARAAAHEDMEAVEFRLLEAEVPRMVRHFRLGHRLKVREGVPLAFAAVIAKAAARMRGATEADEPDAAAEHRLALDRFQG